MSQCGESQEFNGVGTAIYSFSAGYEPVYTYPDMYLYIQFINCRASERDNIIYKYLYNYNYNFRFSTSLILRTLLRFNYLQIYFCTVLL